jgi:hypothetical protein
LRCFKKRPRPSLFSKDADVQQCRPGRPLASALEWRIWSKLSAGQVFSVNLNTGKTGYTTWVSKCIYLG